jgi:hypothetical protein
MTKIEIDSGSMMENHLHGGPNKEAKQRFNSAIVYLAWHANAFPKDQVIKDLRPGGL